MSHRAMMFAGLSEGTCTIDGFLPSEDCVATLNAMRACGVGIEADSASDKGFGPTRYVVEGKGCQLTAPTEPIDCGNAGTGMRLLAGLLAGQPFVSELWGDASLSSRPMNRIVTPLAQMQARIETLGGEGGCPPLRIRWWNVSSNHIHFAHGERSGEERGLVSGSLCRWQDHGDSTHRDA